MTLAEIRDRVDALPALDTKREGLARRLAASRSETDALLAQYKKERRDVEKLEKESFSNFLLRTAGRLEKKAERELQEEAEAKARYDKAAALTRELERETARLEAAIAELEDLAREYKARLQAKRDEWMAKITQPQGIRLAKLEEERHWLLGQCTEVDEAAEAARRAAATANEVQASLSDADGWATWDMWAGGGILTHLAKYGHVDSAEAAFNTLTAQLYELRAELVDVQGFAMPELGAITTGERALDFWLDNIFTDYFVREQIRDNADQVEELLYALGTLRQSLAARRSQLEIQLTENGRRWEDLLVEEF